MNMHYEGDHYMRDNGFVPKPLRVEESTVSKVNLNFSLVRHSISISATSKKITVSLKYSAKKPGALRTILLC